MAETAGANCSHRIWTSKYKWLTSSPQFVATILAPFPVHNILVAEPEFSGQLIPKSAIGHDP